MTKEYMQENVEESNAIRGDEKEKKKKDWRWLQLRSRFNCQRARLMYAIFSASTALKQNNFNWHITKARISTSDVSLIRFSNCEKLQQLIANKNLDVTKKAQYL